MKIKRLFSCFLVFLICLTVFPTFSVTAEAVAAKGFVESIVMTSAYYTNSNGVVTSFYPVVDSDYSLKGSFPLNISLDYTYPDANDNVTFLLIDVEFADESLFYGQTYRLQFDTDWPASAYIYCYGHMFDYNSGNQLLNAHSTLNECKVVGSSDLYPHQFNSYFVNLCGNPTDLAPWYGRPYSGQSFSVDIEIPIDYTSSGSDGYHLVYALMIHRHYCTWSSVESYNLNNFSLVPIGSTVNLYGTEYFYEEVIGSDEDGNESGLKGILKKLTEIPSYISSAAASIVSQIIKLKSSISQDLDDLGTRIGDYFNSLFDILTGQGDSYDPPDEEGSAIDEYVRAEDELNKDYSGDLQAQFDVAGDIFSGNSAYSFVSDLFQELLLDNLNINSLILFSLAIGLCVLILGRRLNA